MSENGLNDNENEVMDSLVQAWNAYVALPIQHTDDIDEFRSSLHRLQHLLMIREIRRIYPDSYLVKENYNED